MAIFTSGTTPFVLKAGDGISIKSAANTSGTISIAGEAVSDTITSSKDYWYGLFDVQREVVVTVTSGSVDVTVGGGSTANLDAQNRLVGPSGLVLDVVAAQKRLDREVWVGADPGLPNASSEIQAAIDSLPNSGGVVVLPYLFNATGIRLDGSSGGKSNVTLKALGWHTGLKKPAHSALTTDAERKSNVVEALSGHGHTVENMRVEGNKSRGGLKPPYCTKHQLGDTFSPTVGRVICTAAAGTSSSGAADDRVFTVTALGAGQVSSAVNISVDLAAGYVTEVTAQPFNEATGSGYMNAYQLDNDFAFREGVYLNGLTEAMNNPQVINCEVVDTVYGGILPGAGPLFASLAGYGTLNALAERNSVHDVGATCIGGGKKVLARIVENDIGYTTSSGIRCDEGSHGCIISGNTIDTNNPGDANASISVYKSNRVVVTGNKGRSALIGLSSAESDGGTYEGNQFEYCGTGISVSKMDGGSISGNECRNNTASGIKVSNGSGVRINANGCKENGGDGIWLLSVAGGTCGDNTSELNGKDGILLDGSTQVALGSNTCRDNGTVVPTNSAGIKAINATSAMVGVGNRCYDTRTGGAKTQAWGFYSDATLDKSCFVAGRLSDNGSGPYNLNGATGNIVALNDSTTLIEWNGKNLLSAATGGTIYLGGPAGSEQFQVAQVAGAVNTLVAKGGTNGTSVSPSLSADGSDANIDIRLIPKGTGSVRFGAWASNADAAVNGYVSIKSADGTVRKLATIA